MKLKPLLFIFSLCLLSLCSYFAVAEKYPQLPDPFQSVSTVKPSTVIGWPAGKMPVALPGFEVSLFADLEAARSIYVLPSGDVLVAQARKSPDKSVVSPNQITLFKMKKGKVETSETLLDGLNLPFGMALWQNELFVAEPERILRYIFEDGKIVSGPVVIATLPFPKPQRHWTRHLLMKPDGSKLYVSVGSASNVGEDGDPLDEKTAAILELNRDGSDLKVFAGGLRNAVTMAWEPTTGELWATVNERDELGDGLVPDYLAKVVRGGFYGWPYSYWGQHEDPRRKNERPDLVAASLVPNFSVGAHTASTGILFTDGHPFPAPFADGALITQHGSWNSSKLVGYKVIYVPFDNGDAVDSEEDFLTGFIADPIAGTVYGRPVMAAFLPDGSILVTDDGAGKIWKVKAIYEE